MFRREELFQDRREAGRALGQAILASGLLSRGQDGIVLGLPRGGIPVAYEVALALHLPLDIVVVRKLGVPGLAELAMGAIAADGALALNAAIIHEFRIPEEVIDAAVEQEMREVERRERTYRNGRSQNGPRAASPSWSTTGWPPGPACWLRCALCAPTQVKYSLQFRSQHKAPATTSVTRSITLSAREYRGLFTPWAAFIKVSNRLQTRRSVPCYGRRATTGQSWPETAPANPAPPG